MYRLIINLPCQNEFIIVTNIKNLYYILQLKYGKYVQHCPEGKTCSDIIEIYQPSEKYILKYNNKLSIVSSAIQALSQIISANKKLLPSCFALHGAALEKKGKAYLFIASSGTGKTTLTSYLLTKGLNYITDDCIIISKDTLLITPYSTPLQLRKGGYELLSKLNIELENVKKLEEHSITYRYSFFPTNYITQEIPIDKIFFINRSESKNELTELSSIEKNKLLIEASIVQISLNIETISFISQLSKIKAYKLTYNSLDYISEVLLENEL